MLLRSMPIIPLVLCALALGDAQNQTSANAKPRGGAAQTERAPDVFRARFDTTRGVFVIEATRAWAPHGTDRFYKLVKDGFYQNCRFFFGAPGVLVGFGINGDPRLDYIWRHSRIPDDPDKPSMDRGYVAFWSSGVDQRTTIVVISLRDDSERLTFRVAPFGRVVEGMAVIDSVYTGYFGVPGGWTGGGPDENRIRLEGNAYLEKSFPKLDYIKSALIVPLDRSGWKEEGRRPSERP
jgi:peptidyl-prolyl cis-trans isomerase A (cyclophilin A)